MCDHCAADSVASNPELMPAPAVMIVDVAAVVVVDQAASSLFGVAAEAFLTHMTLKHFCFLSAAESLRLLFCALLANLA